MKEYNEFGQAAAAVIRGGAALYQTSTATTVRVQGGKGGDVVATDGPYAETKEALTGFYLLECADLDEAIKLAAQIPARVGRRRRGSAGDRLRRVTEPEARAALVRLVRDEGRRVLATLARVTGDLPLAEDAVQDAAVRALESWPRDGVPAEPRAWLTLTARRRAIDILRRRGGARREGGRTMNGRRTDPGPLLRRRCAMTSCGWSSRAATRRSPSRRRWRWPCARSAASRWPRWARRSWCPRRRWPSASPGPVRRSPRRRSPTPCPPTTSCPTGCAVCSPSSTCCSPPGTRPAGAPRPELVDEAVRLTRLLRELHAGRAVGARACSRSSCCRTPGAPPATTPTARPCCSPTRTAAGGGATSSRRAWCSSVRACAAPPTCPTRTSCRPRSLPVTRWRPTWADTDWGRRRVLVRRAAHRGRHPGRAAQPRGRGGERDGPAAGLAAVDAVDELGGYPLWHAARAELLARLDRVDDADTAYAAALAIPRTTLSSRTCGGAAPRLGDRPEPGDSGRESGRGSCAPAAPGRWERRPLFLRVDPRSRANGGPEEEQPHEERDDDGGEHEPDELACQPARPRARRLPSPWGME